MAPFVTARLSSPRGTGHRVRRRRDGHGHRHAPGARRARHDPVGSEFDARVLETLHAERRHPALPEHLPDSLAVLGPDELAEAGRDVDLAVLARELGRRAQPGPDGPGGLRSARRSSSAWPRASSPRPACACPRSTARRWATTAWWPWAARASPAEIAQGLPTAAVFAAADVGGRDDGRGPVPLRARPRDGHRRRGRRRVLHRREERRRDRPRHPRRARQGAGLRRTATRAPPCSPWPSPSSSS